MKGITIKNTILTVLATMGSVFAEFLGGWDAYLKALVIFMTIDYITGVLVAVIFHKSDKTGNGGASSRECYKGIVKKVCMLAMVGLSVSLDTLSKTNYIRSATIFFFLGNEGISILENIGLMGMKYPAFIKKALEVIIEKGEQNEKF